MDQGKALNILYIPRWYPSELDPQLGVFIRKHAEAASRYHNIAVIYPQADPGMKNEFKMDYSEEEGVHTWRVYYRHRQNSSLGSLKNLTNWFRAFLIGYRQFTHKHGKPDIIHAHVLLRTLLMAWMQEGAEQ